MIDIPALKDAIGEDRDWVMVGPDGKPREMAVPHHAGPATLVVSVVTDAVKRVGADGLIAGSVDRDRLWAVEAFLLNRVVLKRLEGGVVDSHTFLEIVPGTGIAWQVVVEARRIENLR